MKRGRPSSIRLKKRFKRRFASGARRGAGSPKQKAASIGRRRRRR